MCGSRGRAEGLLGQALVLLPSKAGETDESPVAYRASLRQALIDDNAGHVNVVVCESEDLFSLRVCCACSGPKMALRVKMLGRSVLVRSWGSSGSNAIVAARVAACLPVTQLRRSCRRAPRFGCLPRACSLWPDSGSYQRRQSPRGPFPAS